MSRCPIFAFFSTIGRDLYLVLVLAYMLGYVTQSPDVSKFHYSIVWVDSQFILRNVMYNFLC